jgi:flavin reductase (DIM6/NTAB) family NADH-FMN oxidoreductase RutF
MQAYTAEPTFLPDATNARAFRDALGRFATGIAVITTQTADGPVGFTANSFASVSLDPPLVLWSPAKSSARYPVFAAAQHYTIHILGADQADLCLRFVRGGAGFDGLHTEINAEGTPVIPGTLARFDCAQSATHDGGDHLIVVGRVLRAASTAGDPLVFSQGAYGVFLGKT